MISLGVAFNMKYNYSSLLFKLMSLCFFGYMQRQHVKVVISCGSVISFAKHTKVVRHNSGLSLTASF